MRNSSPERRPGVARKVAHTCRCLRAQVTYEVALSRPAFLAASGKRHPRPLRPFRPLAGRKGLKGRKDAVSCPGKVGSSLAGHFGLYRLLDPAEGRRPCQSSGSVEPYNAEFLVLSRDVSGSHTREGAREKLYCYYPLCNATLHHTTLYYNALSCSVHDRPRDGQKW